MKLEVRRGPADRLVSGAAIAAVIVAVLVLAGWLFDVAALRTIAPVWSAMAPLTPFLLIFISVALVCFERHRKWANASMLLAGVLAGAALLEYLFGVPLGLSALSRGLDVMNAEFQPELPDPETAAATLLLVMTMLCYRTRHRRLHDFADVVVVLIGIVCLQVLLAYTYNVLASESWRGFRQIAGHTTLSFMVLAFAATARRRTPGLYDAMRGEAPSAIHLRRLLPTMLAVCVLIGGLHGLAVREGIAPEPELLAWTVVSAIVMLALLLFVINADMRKAEALIRERQEELQAAKSAAEAASEAKSRFMAVMSHELRTPLTAVIGYANLLDEGLGGEINPEARNYVDRIRASGWHVVGLIDAVLLYASGEAASEEIRHQRVDVGELVATTSEMFEREARLKGLELRTEAEGRAYVIADLRKLRQMLTNLLGNAVKFTDRGAVTTHVRVAGDKVLIEVADTGIGIDAAQLDHIWEPFHQVDASHTRTRGGMGLGLALTRKIADQIGARLAVRSNPGGGSTFSIELPRADDNDARAIGLNGARVLVVDDEPGVRRIMVRTLTRYGGDVTQAESAQEALASIGQQNGIDVLVTDISMPGMTGIELAQRLKSRAFASPILFVTGAELDGDDLDSIAALGGQLLRKPFDMVELARAVQLMVETKN